MPGSTGTMTTEADRIRKIEANHIDVDIAFFGEIGVVTLALKNGRRMSASAPLADPMSWIKQEDEMIDRCLARLGL